MTDAPATLLADYVARGASFLDGAIDFYVHAGPDAVPRRVDEITLAAELAAAGLVAAVHRHHSSSTIERSELTRAVTGFRLLGGIELNEPTGGLSPLVVECGLRAGATFVTFPTLSGSRFRRLLSTFPAPIRGVLDAAAVALFDDSGALVPEVHDILALIKSQDAILITGYQEDPELYALIESAVALGLKKIVLCNPLAGAANMSVADIAELAHRQPVWVELSICQLHPFGSQAVHRSVLAEAAELVSTIGAHRVILSTDSGMADAPAAADIFAAGCAMLVELGLSANDVRRMTSTNPASLLA